MSLKTLLRSFAGGVITPEMFGRVDTTKFQTGLAEASGFETLPHGPLVNSPGFEYVLEVKDSTKGAVLIPFVYSTTQSMVLEFGDLYVRFHTQGGNLLEANTNISNITQANPGVVTSVAHGYNTGDWVFVDAVAGMTQMNRRYLKVVRIDANNYSLTDLAGVAVDTSAYGAYGGAGVAGRVYEIVSPYAFADLLDLHYTQSNDVLTIVHPTYQQRELRRLGATNWQFAALTFSPTQAVPTAVSVAASPASGATLNRYQVTAISTDKQEESYPVSAANGAAINITAISKANPGVLTVPAHGRTAGDYVYLSQPNGMTELKAGDYLVNAVVDANNISLKRLDGTLVDTTNYTAWTSGGSIAYTSIANDLTVGTNTNTVSWTAASNAARYNVYKFSRGLWGYIGQTVTNSFADNNITPDVTKTPPIPDDPYTSANNYPGATGYRQGRRWFGGSNNKPQSFTATRSGTESNMSYSIPSRDDDRISVTIRARQANAIRHFVPLNDMLLLTSGGEWAVTALNSDTLTPTSVDPQQQDAVGASNVQPVIASGGTALYARDRGGRINEIAASPTVLGRYATRDISIMAPHYFDKYTIRQMAFTRAPTPIAWAVRSDGVLLGLTYIKEHQVEAWWSRATQGTFESICAVPEGSEDVLYAVVKRTINGRTVRYVERRHTRLFNTLADAFFVDAGSFYNSTPATVITGLDHLNGATVNALADGAVVRNLTVGPVAGGVGITLEQAASKVAVGLQITARFKTLPVSVETQALGQGTQKNVNKAYLFVNESSNIQAGPAYDKLKQVKQRTTEPYGSPPALVSDEKSVVLAPQWNAHGQICVEQSDPLPLTVMSMTLDVSLGG